MTEESVTREAQFLPQNFSFKGNNSHEQITAEFLLSNQNNESKIEQPKLNQNFPIILTHYHLSTFQKILACSGCFLLLLNLDINNELYHALNRYFTTE